MQLNDQMPIKIEKNVPLATKRQPRRKGRMFPLDKMEVGDSFLLRRIRSLGTLNATASKEKRMTGRVFTVLKTEQGYRCWRVS